MAGGAPFSEQAPFVRHGVDVFHVPGEPGDSAAALHVSKAGQGHRRSLGEY